MFDMFNDIRMVKFVVVYGIIALLLWAGARWLTSRVSSGHQKKNLLTQEEIVRMLLDSKDEVDDRALYQTFSERAEKLGLIVRWVNNEMVFFLKLKGAFTRVQMQQQLYTLGLKFARPDLLVLFNDTNPTFAWKHWHLTFSQKESGAAVHTLFFKTEKKGIPNITIDLCSEGQKWSGATWWISAVPLNALRI